MVKRTLLIAIVVIAAFINVNIPVFAAQKVSVEEIKEYIVKCAVEMEVEPEIALGIAKQESGFCQEKRSSAGAVGVFQIMPSTARKIGFNPYHYKDNIKGGISYYKTLKKMFKTDEMALAAYNAGPGNVKKFGGVPPYAETKKFVKIVLANYNSYKTNPDPTVEKYLFAIRENQENNKKVLAEKEHREILTIFMLNQAI